MNIILFCFIEYILFVYIKKKRRVLSTYFLRFGGGDAPALGRSCGVKLQFFAALCLTFPFDEPCFSCFYDSLMESKSISIFVCEVLCWLYLTCAALSILFDAFVLDLSFCLSE